MKRALLLFLVLSALSTSGWGEESTPLLETSPPAETPATVAPADGPASPIVVPVVIPEPTLQLHIAKDTPVTQVIEYIAEFSQDLPDHSLTLKTKHLITIELALVSRAASLTLAPLQELCFTIKRMQIDLQGNNVLRTFDTEESTTSPEIAQLQHILGKPIFISFDGQFHGQQLTAQLLALMETLPLAQKIFPIRGLVQTLANQFSLIQQQPQTGGVTGVHTGLEFPYTVPLSFTSPSELTLKAQITSASDQDVQATFEGEFSVDEQLYKKEAPKEIAKEADKEVGKEESQTKLTLTGGCSGKAGWARTNALLYHTKEQIVCSGTTQIDGSPYPTGLNASLRVTSELTKPAN